MKVLLITRHAISNYGSLLQTIATQKVVNDLGYECEVVDYIRDDEDYHNIAKSQLKKNEKWNGNIAKRMVYLSIQSPEYYIMGRKFEKMQRKYLKLSERCTNDSELKSKLGDADIYLTGSDQVWGPIGDDKYDLEYFLDFVPEGKKKIAYAGSFGRTNFDKDILETYTNSLKKYDSIAVREKSAMEIIGNMGIKDVPMVLDPTLLLSSDEWSKYIPEDKKYGDYVLIYQLHKNSDMDKYAEEFAKKAGLPLIRVTPMLHQMSRSGKTAFLPELGEFLGYVKNAKYMITDSFHGTAFAINFNTNFINVLSAKHSAGKDTTDEIMKATKTRNQSILELTGLTDHILKDFNDFSYIGKSIDFEPVNAVIAENREKSMNILKNMLGGTD